MKTMDRRITPKPFAAVLAKAATVLDIGATSVSRATPRYLDRVTNRESAEQRIAKDWATVGRHLISR